MYIVVLLKTKERFLNISCPCNYNETGEFKLQKACKNDHESITEAVHISFHLFATVCSQSSRSHIKTLCDKQKCMSISPSIVRISLIHE